jgi:NADPH:quinone reductase-like Zn-dependent oxidoreductase
MGRAAAGVAFRMPSVVTATAYGGPEVLTVTDQAAGPLGPGEARVAVRAAGVNPIDWKAYSGQFGTNPAALPMRLGAEAAGTVTEVGPGTAGPAGPLRPGDDVIAYRASGAYAAELVLPGSALVPKPAALDWAQAACLMVTGVTAWHVLAATGVRAGDTVLLHGASGGVGTIAVQLAVARGATVLATASPARHDFLRGLGAIPVAYGPGLAGRVRAAAPGGVTAAADLIGTDEAIDVSLELVADRARIATVAGFARGFAEKIKVLGGAPGADPGTQIRDAARMELTRLAADGAVRVFVAAAYPLTAVADAHRASMTGHAGGKLALIV